MPGFRNLAEETVVSSTGRVADALGVVLGAVVAALIGLWFLGTALVGAWFFLWWLPNGLAVWVGGPPWLWAVGVVLVGIPAFEFLLGIASLLIGLPALAWERLASRRRIERRPTESTHAVGRSDQEYSRSRPPTAAESVGPEAPNQRPAADRGMESHLSKLKPGLVVIGIGRDDVESHDISHALGSLVALLTDPETVRRLQGKVAIVFEGYDDDPREVYEIPEVRRFCNTLDERFPYWFYFLTTIQQNLKVVTLCLVRVKVKRSGQIWVDTDDLQRFLLSRLSAMNTVFDRCGLGEKAKLARTEQVCEHLSP